MKTIVICSVAFILILAGFALAEPGSLKGYCTETYSADMVRLSCDEANPPMRCARVLPSVLFPELGHADKCKCPRGYARRRLSAWQYEKPEGEIFFIVAYTCYER